MSSINRAAVTLAAIFLLGATSHSTDTDKVWVKLDSSPTVYAYDGPPPFFNEPPAKVGDADEASPAQHSPQATPEQVSEVRKAQRAAYAISDASNGCPLVGSDMLGWPGKTIRRCVYKEGPKGQQLEGVVYLLDIQPDVIAGWIKTTCQRQMPDASACFSTVLRCAKENSGMMLPISGNMMENMDGGPWKSYFFRNGMTVSIGSQKNGSTSQIPLDRQEALSQLPNSAIRSIPSGVTRLWRTLPGQFAREFPDEGLPSALNSPTPLIQWLDVVRAELSSALSSPENRLLDAYVAAHPRTLRAGQCPGDGSP